MRRRLERRVDAYRDREASSRARKAMERRATSGSEAERLLREREALGVAIRAAWTEGPPAPSPDVWMADLHRGLAAVDAEIEAERSLAPVFGRLRDLLLQPAPALAVGLAAAVLALVLFPDRADRDSWLATTAIEPTAIEARGDESSTGDESFLLAEADTAEVYDLGGDNAVMVFDEPDATLIWVVEDSDDSENSEDLSGLSATVEEWA